MVYDRNLTFAANAANLLEPREDYRLLTALTNMLRDAYDDGWLDARATQQAGLEIPECSPKWE